jgi:hypothetical protein
MKTRKLLLDLAADPNGFVPTTSLRWVIRKNDRPTAREEAIATKIIQEANPRENLSGHFPWGPEEQLVLQQLWRHRDTAEPQWRDVPVEGAESLYSTVSSQFGDIPIPNAVREPGVVRADFQERLNELGT